MTNPYAPTTREEAPGREDTRDRADVYIDSLPPPIAKAAALAWFALAFFVGIFCVHILTDLRVTVVVGSLGAIHFLLALGCVGVGIGILRGSVLAAILGFGATPFLLIASVFALWTGALAGLLALGPLLLAPALTAASWKAVVTVGRARAVLAREPEADGPRG